MSTTPTPPPSFVGNHMPGSGAWSVDPDKSSRAPGLPFRLRVATGFPDDQATVAHFGFRPDAIAAAALPDLYRAARALLAVLGVEEGDYLAGERAALLAACNAAVPADAPKGAA